MSVDILQEKIRKVKNPSVVVFEAFESLIPPHILEESGDFCEAYERFGKELLEALKGTVGVARFGFGSFALRGEKGMALLTRLLQAAKTQGYYVILDGPELLSLSAAQNAADILAGDRFMWDGLVINSYLGSDVIKPFLDLCRGGKSLFPVVRTANKSASEIQDLLTGGRLVHVAAADVVNRLGEPILARCGYFQVGALAAASSADGLRSLRGKYPRLFLLLDGYDYPNANAKNCSFAFDKLGHGAAACAGASILGAWKDGESDGRAYLQQSVEAAERMKKNLTRYTTVL